MVLSLVIASCETEDTGGTVTQEDKGQTVTVGEEKEEMEEEKEEKPFEELVEDLTVVEGLFTFYLDEEDGTHNG